MGSKDRIKKLEQSLGGEVGPPPPAYYDAKARRGRYMQAMMTLGLDGELDPEERAFMESYRGSEKDSEDARLVERYSPPVSAEVQAQARERMREALDEVVRRRRERGY